MWVMIMLLVETGNVDVNVGMNMFLNSVRRISPKRAKLCEGGTVTCILHDAVFPVATTWNQWTRWLLR
jgi:hypothetical protein